MIICPYTNPMPKPTTILLRRRRISPLPIIPSILRNVLLAATLVGNEDVAREIKLCAGWAIYSMLGARQRGLEAKENPGCRLGLGEERQQEGSRPCWDVVVVDHRVKTADCGARWHNVGLYVLEEVGVEKSWEGVVGGQEGQAVFDGVSDMLKVVLDRDVER